MGRDAKADRSSEPGLEPGLQATIEAVVTEDMPHLRVMVDRERFEAAARLRAEGQPR